MSQMNPKFDEIIDRADKWQEEFHQLRTILLDFEMAEEIKWGWPCYTDQGSNIVLIHGFNDYCALLFFKGALLTDPKDVLVQQTENTQAARQLRFTEVDEIVEMEPIIKGYVTEAIEVERAGLEVEFRKTSEYEVPVEFQNKLDEIPALKAAFDGLTPGRQRGYLLYFSGAKQSKTRESRVERYIDHILDGKGLNDQ
jgi:uncharacterized protein YdeI (YjbR/CyaY-like superfamily)